MRYEAHVEPYRCFPEMGGRSPIMDFKFFTVDEACRLEGESQLKDEIDKISKKLKETM